VHSPRTYYVTGLVCFLMVGGLPPALDSRGEGSCALAEPARIVTQVVSSCSYCATRTRALAWPVTDISHLNAHNA